VCVLSNIRILGLAISVALGVANSSTVNTVFETGYVDTESADNSTGFHLGDTWTLIITFNSLGLDTFTAESFAPPSAVPNVWYRLPTECNDQFFPPTSPCLSDVLFQGPAPTILDLLDLQFVNGQPTLIGAGGGESNLDWAVNNPNNRWSYTLPPSMSVTGVSGPITSVTAIFTPEPGACWLTMLVVFVGAALALRTERPRRGVPRSSRRRR
jgi:hypothetical protein